MTALPPPGELSRHPVDVGQRTEAIMTQSTRSNSRAILTRGYEGEIDLFAVYCPETDRVYAVPLEDAARSHMYLRVEPTANHQSRGIRWAADFELPA